jgi:hypothetical protein
MKRLITLTEADIVRLVQRLVLREAPAYTVQQLTQQYLQAIRDFEGATANTGAADYDYNSPEQTIVLSNGKFRGARVPKQLIVDLLNAAHKAGIDPYLLLGLCGQESTFGAGDGDSQARRVSKQALVSGYTLRNQYRPYDLGRFLADNRVPGVTQQKTVHGLNFAITDENAVNQYLTQHPNIAAAYLQKLSSAPKLDPNTDDFQVAANVIKQKGLKSYNPGDPSYPSKVQQCIQFLKTDPNLSAFLKNPVVPPKATGGRQPRRARKMVKY